MKRTFLILICLLLICSFADAQYGTNKTKYRIDKIKYDYHTYSHQVGDRYNPSVIGACSIIPGLGQCVSGQIGRGAAFFGGFMVCDFIVAAGFGLAWNGSNYETFISLALVGLLGMIGVDIWSVVDAVRVAKVKDLAFRDKNKTLINLQIKPYINPYSYNIIGKLQSGISLKFTF